MNLTSLARVKIALGISSSDEDGVLLRLVSTCSARIASWLKRDGALQLMSRTEYLNPTSHQTSFNLKAYPIASVTSVYTDFTGRFDGDEVLVPSTDYIISSDERQIVFTNGFQNYAGEHNFSGFPVFPKSIRVIYIGGLASTPVTSSWTKSADAGGTMVVGNYIQGGTSGFVGCITATTSGTISYNSIWGVAEAGETISEFTSIDKKNGFVSDLSGPTSVTATLTAVTSRCLAEAYPDLTTACEMHVRYFRSNRDSFENINVLQDGVTRTSRGDLQKDYFSLPEVRDILAPYRNRLIQ